MLYLSREHCFLDSTHAKIRLSMRELSNLYFFLDQTLNNILEVPPFSYSFLAGCWALMPFFLHIFSYFGTFSLENTCFLLCGPIPRSLETKVHPSITNEVMDNSQLLQSRPTSRELCYVKLS